MKRRQVIFFIILIGIFSISDACSPKPASKESLLKSGNIIGRYPILSNVKSFPLDESGEVHMKVCIDRDGKVIFVEFLPETSIKTNETLNKFVTAMKGFQYSKKANAPEQECGKFSYIVDLSAINK